MQHNVAFIPIDAISVQNRFRLSYNRDKMAELETSITEIGLLSPIIVQLSEGQYVLRAGERRLIALKNLFEAQEVPRFQGEPIPLGTVPAICCDAKATALQVLQIEHDENVCRDDFNPLELAHLIKAIWKERISQQGAYDQHAKVGYSRRKLAIEVYGDASPGKIRAVTEALKVADHLADKELLEANPQSLHEAAAIVTQLERKARNRLLHSTPEANGFPSDFTLLSGDFREQAKSLSAVDIVIADPPYNQADWLPLLADFWKLIPAITKPDCYVYLFCPYPAHRQVLALAPPDFKPKAVPLIWYKANLGLSNPYRHYPRESYEMILVWRKGLKALKSLYDDCITLYPKEPVRETIHPDAKPRALYRYLLSHTASPGDKVLDPFCGSGPLFYAALHLRLKPIGIELNREWVKLAFENTKRWHYAILEGLEK